MQEKTIPIIQCPSCKKGNWDIKEKEEGKSQALNKATVSCKECKKEFSITKGILDMIPNPSEDILHEREENTETVETKRHDKDDAWILQLPNAPDFGNVLHPIINQGYKVNVTKIIQTQDIKGKKILEIGAGTCWTSVLLAQAGANVVATDISREKFIGLESAEVFFKEKDVYFDRVLCSMGDLPFIDGSFDIVFCNAAIHHAPDINKTFQEIARVLKKGGQYIQTNEPCCSIFNRERRIDIKKAKKAGMDVADDWNERTYNYFDYRAFLKTSGFGAIRMDFPPSFDLILQSKNEQPITGVKGTIKRMLSFVWGIKPIRAILQTKPFFHTSLIFLGGSYILRAEKIG